jgi:hypothetical protein
MSKINNGKLWAGGLAQVIERLSSMRLELKFQYY